MNRNRANILRVAAALSLCALAAIVMPSCRLPQRGAPADIGLESAPTGTDLAVAARFATAGDDLPKFFLKTLPDSGVVPVRVSIRNGGSSPLLIHSANGMKLDAGFEGFALVDGGGKRLPLAPKEVAARALGAKKAGRYRMRGASSFVAGTLFAPVGAFFMYTEVDAGRYYRPIFGKSFYPALESGMMRPVRLAPGEERNGYLYFAFPRGARPDSCELVVRACMPPPAPRSIPGSSFMFTRGGAPGYLFTIGGARSGSANGLFLQEIGPLVSKPDSPRTLVAPVAAKSASIADASAAGSLAACAVNFQSKGKVFLVSCDGTPALLEEKSFARKLRHVFVTARGALVVTEDAFCYYFDAASRRWTMGVKLGIEIDDTALVNDRLLAFSKGKGIAFFDASGGTPVDRMGEKPLRAAHRIAIGFLDGDLVLLSRGSSTRCDTLSLLDTDAMGEIGRGSLPGKVRAASSDGSNLVVQFEDGTIARIVRGSGSVFSVAEAGYLPFEALALAALPEGFAAIGEGGAFAAGAVGHYGPGTRGALELSVQVR
jgi:hypothetical protein